MLSISEMALCYPFRKWIYVIYFRNGFSKTGFGTWPSSLYIIWINGGNILDTYFSIGIWRYNFLSSLNSLSFTSIQDITWFVYCSMCPDHGTNRFVYGTHIVDLTEGEGQNRKFGLNKKIALLLILNKHSFYPNPFEWLYCILSFPWN